jgi:uncharacterized protein YegL
MKTVSLSSKPVLRASFTLDLASQKKVLNLASSTYAGSAQLGISRTDDFHYRVVFGGENTHYLDDLILQYQLETADYEYNHLTYTPRMDSAMFFDASGDNPYFLLWVTPPSSVSASQILKKDLVMVADVSGSMAGARLEQPGRPGAGAQFRDISGNSDRRECAEDDPDEFDQINWKDGKQKKGRIKMKITSIAIVLIMAIIFSARADGILKIRTGTGNYLTPVITDLTVDISQQVAATTVEQAFINTQAVPVTAKYCFPLHLNASVTYIAWKVDSVWKQGLVQVKPQDTSTTGPGDTPDPALQSYLGASPFYFELPDTILPGQEVLVHRVYIELLAYRSGTVSYVYPLATPGTFTSGTVESFRATVNLVSQRRITGLASPGWSGESVTAGDYAASLALLQANPGAASDFDVEYTLDQNDLGMAMISYQPDTGDGYFLMIAEPDPSTSGADVLGKVFVFVLDNSGSMGGAKIEQAKQAARYCISNLNAQDRFNLVVFNSTATRYQPTPQPATSANIQAALNYINGITAGGGTNINSALVTALSQYTIDTTSNIIIFLTDGQASVDLQQISTANVHDTRIFSFGKGRMRTNPSLRKLLNRTMEPKISLVQLRLMPAFPPFTPKSRTR